MVLRARIVKADYTTTDVCTDNTLEHWDIQILELSARGRVEFAINMNLPEQQYQKRMLVNVGGGEMTIEIDGRYEYSNAKLDDILEKMETFVSYEVMSPRTLCIIEDTDTSSTVIRKYPGRVAGISIKQKGGVNYIDVTVNFIVGGG